MFFAVAISSLSLSCQQTPSSIQSEAPKVVTRGGKEALVLPEDLLQSIRSRFAGFRIPGQSDLKGPWAIEKKPGSFPFIAWGDFNGDGRTDVATVLLSEKQWKFVIFHQIDRGYISAYEQSGENSQPNALIESPQEIILGVIKRGEEKVVSAGGHELKYKFNTDAIEFGIFEKAMSLMYWKDGKYQSIDFVD